MPGNHWCVGATSVDQMRLAGSLISWEHRNIKWMMTGATPILGHLHMWRYHKIRWVFSYSHHQQICFTYVFPTKYDYDGYSWKCSSHLRQKKDNFVSRDSSWLWDGKSWCLGCPFWKTLLISCSKSHHWFFKAVGNMLSKGLLGNMLTYASVSLMFHYLLFKATTSFQEKRACLVIVHVIITCLPGLVVKLGVAPLITNLLTIHWVNFYSNHNHLWLWVINAQRNKLPTSQNTL